MSTTPPLADIHRLVREIEQQTPEAKLNNGRLPAEKVELLLAYIRSLEDRNVDLATNNKMLLTRQKALESDHKAMREALEEIRRGKMPGDSDNYMVMAARFNGAASEALSKIHSLPVV